MSTKPTDEDQSLGIDTRLTHGPYDPSSFHGFVNPPVVHASTILFPDTETLRSRSKARYSYGLSATPTTEALEDALSELEGAAGTILLSSGLAAVTVPLLAFLGAGDHCLVVDSVYPPTRQFCSGLLKRMGVETDYFDPAIGAGIAELMRPNTKVVLFESPGSNTFEIADVSAIAAAARARSAVTMLDNTWATPLLLRPLDHGVDVSIHALTKYPGGHSDMMLGSASANEACFPRLRAAQRQLGLNAAPDDAYLCLRGLKTMGVRLRHHEASALAVARWLEERHDVARVLHPALPSFPGHALWKRQFKGSSGLFSFVLRGADRAGAARFLDALRIFGLGFSWGGFESLAVPVDPSDRRILPAPEDGAIIRLQIGLEDVADLKADLDRGFSAFAGAK